MKSTKHRITGTPEWLAIDDMFYDQESSRFIKVKSGCGLYKYGLPLLRMDFIDSRSQTDVINGFGMTIAEDVARNLVETFPQRHENGAFYSLIIDLATSH